MTDRVQAYLDRLPDGLGSYADHVCKASVLKAFIAGEDESRLRDALPASLRDLARSTTAVTAWIPEVHLNAVMLARREVFFRSDEAFVADAERRNRELLEGPLYRVLTKLFSPERISAMGRAVFQQMHRGIELRLQQGPPHQWSLHYPDHLMPELVGRCYATAATVALELGGSPVTSTVVAFDKRHIEMELHPVEPRS